MFNALIESLGAGLGKSFADRRWPVSRAMCLREKGKERCLMGVRNVLGVGIGNLSKGLRIFRVGTGKSITVAVIDFVRHGILVLALSASSF